MRVGVAARVAWLTGQSSFVHSRLSRGQDRVLDALEVAGWTPVRVGFPWTEAAARPRYSAVPLPIAGPRNAAQGALALEGPATWFAEAIAHHLRPLLEATSERLLLLCGSAGWPMLGAAVPRLGQVAGPAREPAVDAIAIGGVGPRFALPGGWRAHVLRGRSDVFSALAGPLPVDRVVPGGHLTAATCPATARAVLDLVGSPRVALDGAAATP